ncbi:MAG: flagellar biosynthesis anti-sigma factor FlgM [Candidatus Sedimenticola endophacoides]|uniref:Negative regulator of flagellin synthesis n=1 Tax=Candidatus Sedimenticola endophacoides TaxID=2548426 RepID=A0A657Q3K4_9GAMM|nr:MAG: flagellar biosynthesis anti-sigma factor FlgM [Candidatus Sedimenticola endophacoides]OQX34568.1 MAG: flagellar biosynthesis anti-sigma factor FlgM [Candidatus Sedimenticola endophacoides]OQX41867.1 MAG: flagellar biosynthesis anti-sigma factor FlgM [Candidatus Sedimenticola endophacoides]OQX44731.1 MAG: flagellar biosynthesis anti-sigma factor FlgM [Candidatus Sedimenticola endophacoides]OQX48851.1 MAG: flagellar biosynthesis anti-sigma factor FlgM [Candidatus Sedimenticola endophacoid
MNIHIGGLLGKTIQGSSETKKSDKGSPATGKAATTAGTGSTDTLDITDQAAMLQSVTSYLATLPMVDADQVTRVQLALNTGKYHIEPFETADHIIDQELALARADDGKDDQE